MKTVSHYFCFLLIVLSSLAVTAQDVLYGTRFGKLTEVQVGGIYTDDRVKSGYWTAYYTPWSTEHKDEWIKKEDEKKEQLSEEDLVFATLLDTGSTYDAPEYSAAIEQDFKDRELYLEQPIKHRGAI